MPWRTMTLRGNRVLARCDAGGDLRVDGGRVEIRYKRDDGRAYQAGARNLEPTLDATIFPDDYCAEAKAAPTKGDTTGKTTSSKSKGARGAKKGAAGPPPPAAPTGDEVLVYADGACSGNPGPAGLGVVMLWNDAETPTGARRRELSEFLGHGTNNIAELTAILRACEAHPDKERPLRIYTDSSYSIGVLQKGWKAKANQELVAACKAAMVVAGDVELHYVKGHAGIPLNERADALAVEAVEQRHTAGWQDVA